MKQAYSRVVKSQPSTTLPLLENDDPFVKSIEIERDKKNDKSVHFATEELESVSEAEPSDTESLQTSRDIISWLPSEHLYDDDTFISESHPGTKTSSTRHLYAENTFISETRHDNGQVSGHQYDTFISETHLDGEVKGQTYGTDTFMDLESEDETRTASDLSTSGGQSLSEVFSTTSRDFSGTYREWKDVTEIVKDMEELEESEFVTRADTAILLDQNGEVREDTDVTDSLEAELARDQFIQAQLRRLRLGTVSSPRSLVVGSGSSPIPSDKHALSLHSLHGKARASFCKKAIQLCRGQRDSAVHPEKQDEIHKQVERAQHSPRIELYGLSSAIADRLRVKNLSQRLEKAILQLDDETKKSEQYVAAHQQVEEELARQRFVDHVQRQVEGERIQERIHAHLIKTPLTAYDIANVSLIILHVYSAPYPVVL